MAGDVSRLGDALIPVINKLQDIFAQVRRDREKLAQSGHYYLSSVEVGSSSANTGKSLA